MKSSPFVIIIPVVVALLVVGGVIGFTYISAPAKQTTLVGALPTPAIPKLRDVGKPQVGFDTIQSTQPVSDLRKALESAEDTGFSDLETLAADAAAL